MNVCVRDLSNVLGSFAELPLLSTHWALLLHLLGLEPLLNTMQVETVTTLAGYCKKMRKRGHVIVRGARPLR